MSTNLPGGGPMQFTATTPGPIQQPVGNVFPVGVFFQSPNAAIWFEPGDNITLERIWTPIPHGFGQGSGTPVLGLRFQNAALAFSPIAEISVTGDLIYPDLCGGLTFPDGGLYIQVPKTPSSRWRLAIQTLSMNISQVNLPAALNGQVIDVQVYCMVKHTRPLSTVP